MLNLYVAIGVSLGEDEVNLSRELTGHGVSNLIAGALGYVFLFYLRFAIY